MRTLKNAINRLTRESRPQHFGEAATFLQTLMRKYQTKELVEETPDAFRARLSQFLEMVDWKMEGFSSPEKQRDLSVRFHWGHDHDFGDFSLKGRMGQRHVDILASFIDQFEALPTDLNGKKVLDVGCWTGGASLLLCALGADVISIDEVKKYIEALQYLKKSFGIKNLEPLRMSLFECGDTEQFQDGFDYVLFSGVLYHVTDPILALRTTFNCLKTGGVLLLETAAADSRETILTYEGPGVFGAGSHEDLSRSGWNWFIPSPSALSQMMQDVGFVDVRLGTVVDGRLLAVGRKEADMDIMRSGLSSDIR